MKTKNLGDVFHPLIKFLSIMLLISTLFIVENFIVSLAPYLIFAILLIVVGEVRFALKLFTVVLILTIMAYYLSISFSLELQSLGHIVDALRKIALMFMGAKLFLATTQITDLIKAMERLKVPIYIVLPLAVTLRFIPTIQVEYRAIRDALRVRGLKIGILKPIKSVEFLLVPLLMRCARLSDELSASCITRGISSNYKKTSHKVIKLSYDDLILFFVTTLFFIGIIQMEKL